MGNLEKNLINFPRPKLSRWADFKIKARLYSFLLTKSLQRLLSLLSFRNSLWAKGAYLALVVMIVLGSTAVYAASNDNITLGSALYPLKKTVENVEQQLAISKKSKVDNFGKLSERRLKEAINLSTADNRTGTSTVVSDNIEETINEAVNNIDAAVKTSQDITNTKAAQKAKEEIKKKNQDMIKYLDDIGNIANNKKDDKVIKKVDEAKKAINNYNQILDQDDDNSDIITNPERQKTEKRSDRSERDLKNRNKNDQSDSRQDLRIERDRSDQSEND